MALDINELLKDVQLPDDQKAILQSALTNSPLGKRLEEGFLRQSDYSRQIAEAQAKIKQTTDWYNDLVAWKQTEDAKLAEERAALQRADGSDPNADRNPDVVSRADFEKQLQAVQTGAINFFPILTNTSMKYFQEFGKVLDTAAVIEKARQDGTTFEIAYERFVQPERQAKQEAELTERIKRERAEAVAEFQQNATIPTGQPDPFSNGVTHVLDAIANKQNGQEFGWKAAASAHRRDALAGNVKYEKE